MQSPAKAIPRKPLFFAPSSNSGSRPQIEVRRRKTGLHIERWYELGFVPRVTVPVQRKNTEAIVQKFLLAAALTTAFVTGAIAQTYDPSPRDPPFGKGNPGNDTYHLPNQTDLWSRSDSWGAAGGSLNYGETWRGPRTRRTPGMRTP